MTKEQIIELYYEPPLNCTSASASANATAAAAAPGTSDTFGERVGNTTLCTEGGGNEEDEETHEDASLLNMAPWMQLCASWAVQFHPDGVSIRFRLAPRTCAPWGVSYVW